MTAKELAALSPDKVRNDEDLIRLYIAEYKGVFGFEPSCAGCTFTNDWVKFTRAINQDKSAEKRKIVITNPKTMSQDFKLKRQYYNEILWYKREDAHGRPQVVRSYGRHATNEFVAAYLKEGKKAEIDERKERFEKLPSEPKVAKKEVEKIEVQDAEPVSAPKKKPSRAKKSAPKKNNK